jgi:hypothetical protein
MSVAMALADDKAVTGPPLARPVASAMESALPSRLTATVVELARTGMCFLPYM